MRRGFWQVVSAMRIVDRKNENPSTASYMYFREDRWVGGGGGGAGREVFSDTLDNPHTVF